MGTVLNNKVTYLNMCTYKPKDFAIKDHDDGTGYVAKHVQCGIPRDIYICTRNGVPESIFVKSCEQL